MEPRDDDINEFLISITDAKEINQVSEFSLLTHGDIGHKKDASKKKPIVLEQVFSIILT